MEIERPVERRIAATHDQDIVAAKVFHSSHGVMNGRALVIFNAGHRRALGLEGTATGGDHHDLAEERVAAVARQAPVAVRLARQTFDHAREMEGRMEWLYLVEALFDQPLPRYQGAD